MENPMMAQRGDVQVPGSAGLPADPLMGRVVDNRYRVEERLARGGMATVYKATDLRLDRLVALKIMHPALAEDPGFVARFEREARASARLSHPHVVALHDQGRDGTIVYLVMEYIRGRNVRDILRDRGPLPPQDALAILEPVLQALGAAHSAGFVHRDVKPENVLVSTDGQVKVTDFGLARAIAAPDNNTTHGMLIGTVAYLSPEQVDRGSADPRSDVYSAGILLHELLTGEVPFSGDSPLQVAFQHVHSDVPAPSELVSALSPAIDELVLQATRRIPDQRYADASAFLSDVRKARTGLPAAKSLRELGALPATAAAAAQSVPGAGPVQLDKQAGGASTQNAEAGQAPYAHGQAGGTVIAAFPSSPPRDTAPQAGPLAMPPAPPATTKVKVRKGRPGIFLLLMLLLGVGVAGLGHYLGSLRAVDVPNIVGKSAADAVKTLARVNLKLEVAEEQFSETAPKGTVISSDPAAGTGTFEGRTVNAVTSLGPERYDVPKVAGMSLDEARAAITGANLTPGQATKEIFSENVEAGRAASSDPKAGAPLKKQSAVTILVSKGPKPRPVPKLEGKTEAQAIEILNDLGLQAKTVGEAFSETVPIGRVSSTKPAPGAEVPKGSTVEITMSKGPPPVEVPNVVDLSISEARARLANLGLKVREQSAIGFVTLNRVLSQSPRAGTSVPKGSTVTLTVI